jgi:hypothetical protein
MAPLLILSVNTSAKFEIVIASQSIRTLKFFDLYLYRKQSPDPFAREPGIIKLLSDLAACSPLGEATAWTDPTYVGFVTD